MVVVWDMISQANCQHTLPPFIFFHISDPPRKQPSIPAGTTRTGEKGAEEWSATIPAVGAFQSIYIYIYLQFLIFILFFYFLVVRIKIAPRNLDSPEAIFWFLYQLFVLSCGRMYLFSHFNIYFLGLF